MTLRHNVKTFLGDSWTSPVWAVVLPGGVAVDLTDGWEVTASIKQSRSGETIWSYSTESDGIRLGRAEVTLSNGVELNTSTVVIQHDGYTSQSWPEFVGPWDCQIRREGQTYTIVAGTFRTVGGVT